MYQNRFQLAIATIALLELTQAVHVTYSEPPTDGHDDLEDLYQEAYDRGYEDGWNDAIESTNPNPDPDDMPEEAVELRQ